MATREQLLIRALKATYDELWATYGDGSASGTRITNLYEQIDAALAAPPPDETRDRLAMSAETLDRLARAVAAHAAAVTKAGLPHDSDHGIGEYRAILAAGRYPQSPMIYEAAQAPPPDVTRADVASFQKQVDRWSATHSSNSYRTRDLMYRLLDALKAAQAPSCDPQQVADALRERLAAQAPPPA